MPSHSLLSSLRTIALACGGLLALNATAGPGALDPTFAPTVNGPVYATAVQPDGLILLGGAFTSVNNSSSRSHLARLFANGSLDTTFFTNGSGASSTVWCLAVQTDGRIVIGGDFTSVNGTYVTRVARLNANGAVDGTFVPTNAINSTVLALAVQSDNKVVIGGNFYNSYYFPSYNARLNADGTQDTSFSPILNGAVSAIGIQSNGQIVIGGAFTTVSGASRYHIARLNTDGSLDNAFQNGLNGASSTVRCLQIQTDGKILIGGDFTAVNNTSRGYVARLNTDGSLDTGFNSSSGANGSVYAIAVQPDNSVVIGGNFTSYASYSLSRVARLYDDGTRDTTFSTTGINNLVEALAVQSDGSLLIGGTFTTINTSNIPYMGLLYGDLYPPAFLSQPVSQNTNVGASVSFSVLVSNPTPSYYQWRYDGLDIPGATDMFYSLSNVQLGDAGSYSVFVSNGAGGATSSNAVLKVGIPPAITSQPVSLIATQGQSATFTLTATGTPLNYFWKKNGVFIAGATNTAYTIASVVAGNAATYTCQVSNFLGSVTSTNATLTVFSPPVITVQPVSQTLGVGSNFTVSVTATGNPAPAYQWYKDGSNLPGATAASFTVTGAQTSDAGGYSVVLTNIFGAATSSVANISVLYYAPTITLQPVGQTLLVGSNFTLTVTATGTAPLAYQWCQNGGNLAGATGASYTVNGAQTNDAGAYTVVVTNVAGSQTSMVAYVSVGYAPVVVQQPQPFTNNLGASNAFSVVVFGSEPLLYQWFKDGTALANATNSLLPLPNLQTNQVGYYSVTVTNLYGWTASSNALLTIPGVPFPFLWEGLVAYYPFNGNANDASGNGYNGTVNGAILTLDRFNEPNAAYHFQNASILVTNIPLNLAGNYSFGYWMNLNNYDDGAAIAELTDTNFDCDANPQIYQANNSVFYSHCGYAVINALPFSGVQNLTNAWHHCFASVAADGLTTIYQDGQITTNADVSNWPGTGAVDLTLGASGNSATPQTYSRVDLDDIRIYNRALLSSEVAQLYAYEADVPVITGQPQDQTVAQGGTATFSVTATAAHPLTCQWFEDGQALTGATNATLTLTNVQPNQIGYYSVGVSNAFTGVLSANAALNVSGYAFSQWWGLVAYYPFNGNANDESGNGFDGVVSGAALGADRFGIQSAAYVFDGSSSRIDLPAGLVQLVSGAGPLSASLWLKTDPTSTNSNRECLILGAAQIDQAFIIATASGNLLYSQWGSANNADTYDFVSDNVWHQAAAVFDGTNIWVYVDGALAATGPVASNRGTVGARIGASLAGTEFWSGGIDDVRIYNRALSAAEVQQLYASDLQPGLRLGAQVTTNGLYLGFPAAANLAYSVLFTTNLTSGLWQKLADVPAQSTNSTVQVADPAVTNSPQRFYRLVTPPWP